MTFDPPKSETVLFQIRPAHHTDAYNFENIFQELNWFVPMGEPVSTQSEVAFELKDRYLQQIKQTEDSDIRSFYVAETSSSAIIGYASIYWLPQCNMPAPLGYLTDLYVLREYRNQPIGQGLLDEIIAKARSINCTQLITHRNRTATHLSFVGNRNWEEDLDDGIFTLDI